MKVEELVAKLKSYNQDARVLIKDNEEELAYAFDVGWFYESNGDTNKNKVIIE
jgi:hypothetical protein|tara:strand:- start:46 stop:204 length:159 start_codon:yes stop_codon:yes gene_type:complete